MNPITPARHPSSQTSVVENCKPNEWNEFVVSDKELNPGRPKKIKHKNNAVMFHNI